MKDLIISALIVLFLIGGWLLFDNYSKETTSIISNNLEENIIPLVEAAHWEEAKQQYKKIENQWSRYKRVGLSFLENDQINEIDLCIARAEKYIEAEDSSNSAGELCSIAKQLDLLPKREALTLSNIL